MLGPQRFRSLRTRLEPSLKYDEVWIVSRALGKRLAQQGVMLDVGCHHGESAEAFAEFGWQIHCFEPHPANWPIIESRVLAKYPKIHLIRTAVGEQQEQGRVFYTSPESSGISSLHAFRESHQASFSVDIQTLAAYCNSQGLRHVDFLKIDTEGFDLFVLKGVDWQAIKPRVVVCEFEDNKTRSLGYLFSDMAEFLVQRGYRVIVSEWKPIRAYGSSHQWLAYKDYPCNLQAPDGWGNLIAISDATLEPLIINELKAVSKIDFDLACNSTL